MSLLDNNLYNGPITRIAKKIGKEDSITGAINCVRRFNEQTKSNEEEIEI